VAIQFCCIYLHQATCAHRGLHGKCASFLFLARFTMTQSIDVSARLSSSELRVQTERCITHNKVALLIVCQAVGNLEGSTPEDIIISPWFVTAAKLFLVSTTTGFCCNWYHRRWSGIRRNSRRWIRRPDYRTSVDSWRCSLRIRRYLRYNKSD